VLDAAATTLTTMSNPWELRPGRNEADEDAVTERLVGFNRARSEQVDRRFMPENLASNPVAVFAYVDGELAGGCVGKTEDLWHWLTVDIMWVDESWRGRGLGRALLSAIEAEGLERGCRWAKLNTWDFQAPEFYKGCGYYEYGREVDYPPGHTNFLMRKDLT
jgi:GNAT superfamily N-acetyltransferase